MEKRKIISLLSDEQIEELLKYVPEYSEENSNNIKNKFYKKIKNKVKPRFKRPSVIAASIVLMIVLSSGLVYAGVRSGIIDLNEIYIRIFGDNADYLSQYAEIIEGGSEYDGIKLELISAVKEENKLVVYFTLTDLTEDRLKDSLDFFKKMDLFRNWSIDQVCESCRLLNYDKKTKTATFQVISMMAGVSTSETATLKLKYFLSGLNYKIKLIENQLDIYSLASNNESESVPVNYYLSSSGYDFRNLYKSKYFFNTEKIHLLKADNLSITFSNIDWSKISNIGFIDDELHIKTVLDGDSFNNIISLSFVDKNGNKVYTNQFDVRYGRHPSYSYHLSKYYEFIFENINDISQIKDLKLCLDVSEYGEYIEGNWEAKLMVPSEAKKKEVSVKDKLMLSGKEVFVDKLVLSPQRISVYCKYYGSKHHYLENKNRDVVKIMYKNDVIVDFPYTIMSSGPESSGSDIFSYDLSGGIIRIEEVKSININGIEIVVE